MKKTIKQLFEIQNGSGWPDAWVVTVDRGVRVHEIRPANKRTYILYDEFDESIDISDEFIDVGEEFELNVMEPAEPDHITLLGELVRVVEHFFSFTGSMSLKDFAARRHLETMKKRIDEVGYKNEKDS